MSKILKLNIKKSFLSIISIILVGCGLMKKNKNSNETKTITTNHTDNFHNSLLQQKVSNNKDESLDYIEFFNKFFTSNKEQKDKLVSKEEILKNIKKQESIFFF